jgi:hypothetical protein
VSLPVRAAGYGVLIWLAGFVWGTVVFMTPALDAAPPIPYVSAHPAISFPLLVLFPLLAYRFAGRLLGAGRDRQAGAGTRGSGLSIGVGFALVNALLDAVVLVGLFSGGWSFFANASVWVAYASLVAGGRAAGRGRVQELRP